jgi:hypothetical protein
VAKNLAARPAVMAPYNQAKFEPEEGIRLARETRRAFLSIVSHATQHPIRAAYVPARFAFADFLVELPRRTTFARPVAG